MPVFSYIYSIPYIFLFVCVLLLSIPVIRVTGYGGNYVLSVQTLICLIVLIFFIGFRGFIYSDYETYYAFYKSCPSFFDGITKITGFLSSSMFAIGGWEKGFIIYAMLCKTITQNYFFLQFISFIIDLCVLYYFFNSIVSKQYIILCMLFYLVFSGLTIEFNLLRNSKSIMLFLISLKYLEQRKPAKYFLMNIMGCMFHITSIFYMPLYFFLKKMNKKLVLFVFILGNIIFLLQIRWCKPILLFLSNFVPGGIGLLLKRYVATKVIANYGITIGYIERVFSFIMIYHFMNQLLKNKKNLIFINAFFIYQFIYLYFSEISILLERLALLFVFPYWVLYPQIYQSITKNSKKLFLCCIFAYGVLRMAVGNGVSLSLYDNILFNHKSYNERTLMARQYRIVKDKQ